MSRKRMIYLCLSIAVGLLTFFGWKITARSAYESAQYTVVESESPYEVREYPDLMVVATKMKLDSQGDDGSFMRLFKYISGGNESKQKIAMTVPVFMGPDSSDEKARMEFVLPKKVIEENIPQPTNDNIQIVKRQAGRYAVIRFSGRMNTETLEKAEAQLRAWMKEKGFIADSEAERAGYDPPWTPSKFRRNEILIRLK